ncbi:AAA family ATPase [Microcoleus sp. PH2017_08_TRC_O_A]|uniref:AAA family ATPase n=1 Tax=Microcoleus sp. PH2017_08_TRC_O_A TaxID=2798819 RepID=UPI001D54394C|nr:AAA family ATPase [Microcoleus sp. PH2017_08_TRC_O_A]MCC3454140.1 AAA family ATPase [Microcoleus sp. PH2017_08_TRC_O_A]
MLKLDGYQILTQIYESNNSNVYRGIRQDDNQPVILKFLKEDYPTPSELTRYKQEYEITRNLNLDGVIKVYELKPYKRTLVIILEDFGASSLKHLMNECKAASTPAFPLQEFLRIAIKTAEILGSIHAQNIVHKDINPANIIFNPETGQLKIIDFGISTVLTRENPTLKNPNVLEGTLAYISPEQTGRMNRSLDYRTDFYSLGVTFYELLTGQLPFETTDALELVHCHIAKVPISPNIINPEIPQAISDIVVKLMAKTAEYRYQSAFGIRVDLAECLHQLETKGNISDFYLGTQDISDQFQIPQKLYGREAEVEALLTAFERVATPLSSPLSKGGQRGVEMMLVAGYSGIGKSSLVAEIHKPNTRLRGYFTAGKFDQFQKSIPYSAVVKAFKGLVRQLLTESEAQLEQWREKLRAAFGANGQVIIDVIPEVELIVGEQPPVPKLGASESQNRFNIVFGNFIRTFCTKEHPLVIFLDDLQWADSATLKLIELMMTDADMQYLFLIGAYRDNEVSPIHPLMMTLDGLLKDGATINYITLAPLELENISQLIADTLYSNTDSVKTLAELVMQKTGGNPFFVNQFLKTLYAEDLITFDSQQHSWQWNINQIEAQNITDNVVELMIGKLKKLPPLTQQVLRLASCIGASFHLSTLAIVSEKLKEVIFPDLVVAVQTGFILPTSELDQNLLIQDYKFLHDRIQQASYALIDDDRKKAVHLQIGRLLLANLSAEELPGKIFEIVDHLNLAGELIADESERVELARLNLEAGRKAKASTAYAAALEQYFTTGIEMLPTDAWQEHYDLTFSLYRERSECEYLCGNFEKAEELFGLILTQVKSNVERAEIQNIRLVLYDNTGKFVEAVGIGSEALKSLGLSLPTTDKSEILSALDLELELYRANLEHIKVSELIDAPEMFDPEIRACMTLLMNITGPAYFVDQDLLALISLKMVNLSLENGNSDVSAHGYAFWGFLAGARLVDYEVGYEFGLLSMKLNERFHNVNLACKVFNMFGGLINPWRSHLKKGIPFLRNGYLAGVETGDVYVSYNSYHLILQRVLCSDNFDSILEESNKHLEFLKKIKNNVFAGIQQLQRHFILNLQGLTLDKFSFSDEYFDELQCLQMCEEKSFMPGIAAYNIFKAQIVFFYGDYENALEYIKKSDEIIVFISGIPTQGEHYLYYPLILTALYPTATDAQQHEYGEIIKACQQKMKIWADNCPENFLHKYLLVEAEIARITNKEIELTWDLYDRAIASAHENEYIQNEALGNELAAKFWLGKGKEEIAQLYMKKAHYGYQFWGAKRKVEDLEQKYPQLLPKVSAKKKTDLQATATGIASSKTGGSSDIDLSTVIKASQVLAGAIVLDQLLAKLMNIVLENGGAQTGLLMLLNNGKLTIEATGQFDPQKVEVLQSIAVEDCDDVPMGMFKYVERTQEDIVLSDATKEGIFISEPYVVKNQPKSVLCAPIINQGKLLGILYLENNLTAGAFTIERLEVLKVLSSQAAISIENALLYRTLEDKVKERTAQLAEANQEISTLNELLKQDNLRMSAELDIVKQLQQMVLPKQSELEAVDGLEIAGFMEPADEVGGDYYDVLQQDGQVKISIGDVTGHGLESGVLMIMAQTAVRTLQKMNETDPVKFLDVINQTLYDNLQRMDSPKNMSLAILDYAGGVLKLSGQHEETIVVRADGTLECIDTMDLGFPIGLVDEISDFVAQAEVQLNPGDVVVLYTDGIPEAFDINKAQYGLERLWQVVIENRQLSAAEIREAVIADVREYIGVQRVFDDITLVVLKQK